MPEKDKFYLIMNELIEVAGSDVVEYSKESGSHVLLLKEIANGIVCFILTYKEGVFTVAYNMGSPASCVAEAMYIVFGHCKDFDFSAPFYHDPESGKILYGEPALQKYYEKKQLEELSNSFKLTKKKPIYN